MMPSTGTSTVDPTLVVDQTPHLLPAGTTVFDWEQGGARLSALTEMTSTDQSRCDAIAQASVLLGKFMRLPTPVEQPQSGVSGIPTLQDPSIPPAPAQVEVPLDVRYKLAWEEARRTRSRPFRPIPPAVHRMYRIPPNDWAELGAVRRPDVSLSSSCSTETVGGHPVLAHRDRGLRARDSLLHEDIQATAHLARPISYIGQAVGCIREAFETFRTQASQSRPETEHDLALAALVHKMLGLAGDASADVMDGLARLNSLRLRTLRDSWLDASSFDPDLVKRAKEADLIGGEAPTNPRAEFTAPLCGPSFQAVCDDAFQRKKQLDLLHQQGKGFKKPSKQASQKRKAQGQGGKAPKYSYQQSPVIAPTPQGRAFDREESASRPQQRQKPQARKPGKGQGGKKAGKKGGGPQSGKHP